MTWAGHPPKHFMCVSFLRQPPEAETITLPILWIRQLRRLEASKGQSWDWSQSLYS